MEFIPQIVLWIAFLIPVVIFIPFNYKGYFNLFTTFILSSAGLLFATHIFLKGEVEYPIFDLPFIGDIRVEADLLSGVFIGIISVSAILASIYSMGYIKPERDGSRMNMYVLSYNYLVIAMYLVCVVQNLMAFIIIWEVMSFCSFLLVITEHEKLRTVRSGLSYLIHMHVGVTFLMLAVALVYLKTGQADFASIATYCQASADFPIFDHPDFPIFLLFFLGFGFKLSVIPLHTWGPDTYSSAPPQIAALMSGAMKKLGIFGIIRVLTYIQHSHVEIGIFMILIGCASAIYGIVNAIIQNDMKRALTYSSVENVGIIVMGLGIGILGVGVQDYSLAYLGLCGALLHVINHTMFKSLLFMSAGAVQNSINMMNMNQMGGLIKTMPINSFIFLIASLSICGLPLFNGFISEFLIYGGILEGLNAADVTAEVFLLIALICLALSGGLSIFNYAKMFGISFLGSPRTERARTAEEPNFWLIVPQISWVMLIFSVDLFPSRYIKMLDHVIYMFVPRTHVFANRLFTASQNIALITIVFMVLVLALLLIRHYAVPKSKVVYGPTWGCGYLAPTHRLQYTSSSFSQLFLTYAEPILGYVKRGFSLPKDNMFPKDHLYDTHTYDKLDKNLVKNFVGRSEHFMQYFAFLQTGRLQHYVIYGFAFMFLIFILTFTHII
jgi:formate hydrogenlyase subunit 3/multisubunit Na+/H+ antiporter MnhD subunit